jgi:hypothetical protein
VNGIKKGIRCKTGAVPAAVNPNCYYAIVLLNYKSHFSLYIGIGKASTAGISQKTCHNSKKNKFKLRDKKLEKYRPYFSPII